MRPMPLKAMGARQEQGDAHETMARAADALGMERKGKGDALLVKVGWMRYLRLETEGGPVRSTTRYGWKPDWLYYMQMIFTLSFFCSVLVIYPFSSLWVLIAFMAVLALVDLVYGTWKIAQRKRVLFQKAAQLAA
jgi:hypothetical protein